MHKNLSYKSGNIHYYKTGNGKECIIFLHGFLENISMWNDIIPEFSKSNTVISIDLPGHGKTSTFGKIHTMEFMVDVVNEVLKKEAIKNVKLVGHSMGGYVALAFGKKFSSKTKSICLLNSTAMADSAQKKKDRLRAAEVMQKNFSLFVSEAIPNLFAAQNRKRLKSEISEAVAVAKTTDVKGAVACTLGMRSRKSSVNWIKENSKIEVSFIAGENDPIIHIKKILIQVSKTNVQLSIVKDVGHMLHLENKKTTLKLLSEHL